MAKLKTTETTQSVTGFINAIKDETKRKDCFEVVAMMRELTGLEPKMWGPSIVGFGSYHYKYASGHEGDMPMLAFSPRAAAIVFYICDDFTNKAALLQQLGKHTTGKVCLYVKKLSDVDVTVLKKILAGSYKEMQVKYPSV